VPQIRALAGIVHSKYSLTYLLTYKHQAQGIQRRMTEMFVDNN